MKFDLSKFQKIHEDADSAELQHEAGHTIKIAKGALSKHLIERLGALPFAEGGRVPLPVDKDKAKGLAKGVNDGGSISEGISNIKKAFGYANGGVAQEQPKQDVRNMQPLNVGEPQPDQTKGMDDIPQSRPFYPPPQHFEDGGLVLTKSRLLPQQQEQMAAPKQQFWGGEDLFPAPKLSPAGEALFGAPKITVSDAEPEPINQSMPAVAAPTQAAPQANPMAAFNPGIAQETRGIQQGAEAQAQLGQEQAVMQQQRANSEQQMMQSHQQHWNELEAERAAVMADYKAGHIDPNRFLSSQNAGGKAMTAIGLILGGIGGGGKGNLALDFLNKQIDRDVEAQKAELGKNDNILSHTMKQFGNLNDATTMTRLLTADQYISKLEEAKARATSPIAKANADISIGQLKQKYAPLQAQLAQSMTMKKALEAGQLPAEQAIQSMVPEHSRAEAYKQLGEIKSYNQNVKNVKEAMSKVESLQKLENRVGSPFQSNAQINALNGQILGSIGKAAFGNMSESELELAKDNLITILNSKQTAAIKRQSIENLMKVHKPPTTILDAYGLAPKDDIQTKENTTRPSRK